MKQENLAIVVITAAITALLVGGIFLLFPVGENNYVREGAYPGQQVQESNSSHESEQEPSERNQKSINQRNESKTTSRDFVNKKQSEENGSEGGMQSQENSETDENEGNQNESTEQDGAASEISENIQNQIDGALEKLKFGTRPEAKKNYKKIKNILSGLNSGWSGISDLRQSLLEAARSTPFDEIRVNIFKLLVNTNYPGWTNDYRKLIDEVAENPDLSDSERLIVAQRAIKTDPVKVGININNWEYEGKRKWEILESHTRAWENFIENRLARSRTFQDEWEQILEEAKAHRKKAERIESQYD